MDLPDNCIRGIPNGQFLDDEGKPKTDLFIFHERDIRDDGWIEQSINWEDNDGAIQFTLSQRKNEELQFSAGAAVISRHEIDRLSARPMVNGMLSYERRRLEDNPYHGNMLLRTDLPKHKMKMIAAGLALIVSRIVPQERSLPELPMTEQEPFLE